MGMHILQKKLQDITELLKCKISYHPPILVDQPDLAREKDQHVFVYISHEKMQKVLLDRCVTFGMEAVWWRQLFRHTGASCPPRRWSECRLSGENDWRKFRYLQENGQTLANWKMIVSIIWEAWRYLPPYDHKISASQSNPPLDTFAWGDNKTW